MATSQDRVDLNNTIGRLLQEAPAPVRLIVTQVLQLESDHLHMKQPWLKDDVLRIIRKVVAK